MRHITDTATDPVLKKSIDRRMLAIVLGCVGAALLITASLSKSWMGNDNFGGIVRDRDGRPSFEKGSYLGFRGDIRFGPLGFERCAKPYRGFEMHETPAEVTCESISTAEFNRRIGEAAALERDKYTSGAFSPAGWIAFATCLLSAAGLLVSAGLVFARKKKELPISPASVALIGIMGAMASGCVFIATKPGPAGMLGVDLGFWAFGAGTVIGILSAQLLAKELRPPDPDLLAGALDPEEFAAFRAGHDAPAAAPVPVPLPAVPPTQPVEALALTDGSPADPEAEADSPGGGRKPDDVSS
jgi:hypothetical protein